MIIHDLTHRRRRMRILVRMMRHGIDLGLHDGGVRLEVAGVRAVDVVCVGEDGDADCGGDGVEGGVEVAGEVGEVDGAGVADGFEGAGGVEVAGWGCLDEAADED